ncbi:MAG: hypothetical protein ACRCX2_21535, partial [Paraclostridium sp.]
MKIEKEITTNKEVIGNQNKNNGGTKMKDALKKMMGNLEFGEANSDEVRMTMTGALAFNDGEDNWLSFNPITKTLVNNLEMVMDMPGFKMPKLRDQLQIGELITINNGTDYGFIIDVKPTQLKVLKKNGSVSTIKEIGNIMGTQSFYTVVKSINDFAGQGQNGMAFNPMMLAYMKGDDEDGGKDSSEMMKLIAMQGLFMNNPASTPNGAIQNPMATIMSNPMMLASMLRGKGKKGKGSSMEDMIMVSMMSQVMQMGMIPQPGLVQGNSSVEVSTENVEKDKETVETTGEQEVTK